MSKSQKASAKELRTRILDIAMNLNRIGNWAADDFYGKKKRIEAFLNQTNHYVSSVNSLSFSQPFQKTLKKFLSEYKELEREGRKGPQDQLFWAEKLMTWGNILTHRSRLI